MAWQSLSENTKCAICRGMALAAICLTKFGKALKLYGYDTKILKVARDCVLQLQVISIHLQGKHPQWMSFFIYNQFQVMMVHLTELIFETAIRNQPLR